MAREWNALAAHALDLHEHLHGEQRMSAKIEEIVERADATPRLEELFPDPADLVFHGGAWRLIGRRVTHAARRRQRAQVDLAVSGERKAQQHFDRGGHHDVRQPLAQSLAHTSRVQRDERLRHHVGHQALVAGRILAHHGHGFRNVRLLEQYRLDLTEFDAMAAQLHLMITATDVLDLAVGELAAKVARSLQYENGLPGLRRDRARASLGGEFQGG